MLFRINVGVMKDEEKNDFKIFIDGRPLSDGAGCL